MASRASRSKTAKPSDESAEPTVDTGDVESPEVETPATEGVEPSGDVDPNTDSDEDSDEDSDDDVEDSGTISETALTLTPRLSTGVVRAPRTRDTAPNPTLDTVKHSLENDVALAFDVANENQAKEVKNLLRRAAQTLGCGLKLSATAHDNGTVTVDFHATARKRQRSYTVDDIRAWAKENGHPHEGPVSKETREAFKAARAAQAENEPATNDPAQTETTETTGGDEGDTAAKENAA